MKLTLSNGFALPAPFAIEEWSENTSKIPKVTYPDIYSYLIDTPSEFRKEKMKCYKSLEAYNCFVDISRIFILMNSYQTQNLLL